MTPLSEASKNLHGAVRLNDWGVLRARGADALSFLHSQLTQGFAVLPLGQARLTGYCSAKGRLLASLVAWRTGEEEVLLACSADLLAATLKRLTLYVLRAKCRLDDASHELALFGLAGASAQRWLGDAAPAASWRAVQRHAGWVIALPDAEGVVRFLLAQAADAAPPDLPALGNDAWRWLEVRSAVPRISASTVEQFVPQMVNLELVGGVDFQKGCYPGQEIVARSQYRGTLKRRMFLFDSDGPAQPGQEVFHSGDATQPAGMVVNAAPSPAHGSSVLAEVKLAALASGTLHLARPGGAPLHQVALPYALPDPAAP
jgi:tRNA-modifying protein YgfZ